MLIRWYGHAAFRITTAPGVTIIIDPYESGGFGGAISYAPITDAADIVLISHDHADHNCTATIEGAARVVRKKGVYDIQGVRIKAIPTFHDPSQGSERGRNLIFVIEADGLKVVHLGDLGHLLDQDVIAQIGKTDVLMLPVGGFFTIDADAATQVMNGIRPSIAIPMHFKTEKVEFPITGADEFTRGKERVRRIDGHEIEVAKESLPGEPEIIVLRYAN
jgi:L-ascorbate metabolism protein UlaG (beta-lactamase superfamily)